MDKQRITEQLTQHHEAFLKVLGNISDEKFTEPIAPGEWTPAQQLDHIHKSAGAFNVALMMPKFIWKRFGVAKSPSRSYEQLIEDYRKILNAGGESPSRFLPAQVKLRQRSVLTTELPQIIENMNKRLKKLSEEELDKYRLPHPLLGKLTLREMGQFTIYHVQHHQLQVCPDSISEA